MTSSLTASELLKATRRALQHLYDPVELRGSPLLTLLGLPASDNRVAEVRRLLEQGIEALKPAANLPGDAPARRYYDVLVYRFIEQSGQKEVAADMALSLRHFQRLEAAALRALAELLAARHNLALVWDAEEKTEEDSTQVQQEIDWLRDNYPIEKIDLSGLLNPVIERVWPLLATLHVQRDLPNLPPVEAQVIPMQQALQHLLGLVAQHFQDGTLKISANQVDQSVTVTFHAESSNTGQAPQRSKLNEGISLAESLAMAAGGKLRFQWLAPAFEATLTLKTSDQARLVLVVDDNQDTLLLLERYLANSRYTYAGTRQPEKLLALVDELHPAIVLLDVMLPGIDGWTLLSHLRGHSAGRNLPVIISTILPQEKIALMLGADAFLKKPFTPQELLATLDRLL